MEQIRNIVIVGGGTAGWLTACLLASRHDCVSEKGLSITLIESPEIPTIGVGEGTWPTLRKTLHRIGIEETDFLRVADASFKQGSRFDGWASGAANDLYYHPFDLPIAGDPNDLLINWSSKLPRPDFASYVGAQSRVCEQSLAPRQRGMPDYSGALNYGYHMDAVKLANYLSEHSVKNLGVRHISDHVETVIGGKNQFISGVKTRSNGTIKGDFFVDCTGAASLLIGQHYGIGIKECSNILFNDRALSVQVPVDAESPINSQTISTAHDAGWIWDIGLPSRRGIGCVYSSEFINDDQAEVIIHDYVAARFPSDSIRDIETRRLTFKSGYREKFWHQNCVAIGLSAGFLEPLEASAIVLVELSAEALVEDFPNSKISLPILSQKFNDVFRYRWERIVDFLKLHYFLSQRNEPYWIANRQESTCPTRLIELLKLWKFRPPNQSDFLHANEVFPAASYQYVLYGMGFPVPENSTLKPLDPHGISVQIKSKEQQLRKFLAGLPTNRALINTLHKSSDVTQKRKH